MKNRKRSMKTFCYRIIPFFVILPLLLFAGCATITVQSLGDEAVDFSNYKRFAVIEPSSFPSTADPRINPITMGRINQVIEEQLLLNGFYKTYKEEADFLVASYASIKGKIDVTSYGYNYRSYGYYGGWGITDTAVREYDEGTLVIDFIDAAHNRLIWRGWATGPVSADPDLTRMRDAVTKILAQYPPL